MRVPSVIFADERLIRDMDHKVYEQIGNVAALPGIQKVSYAMRIGAMGFRSAGSPRWIRTGAASCRRGASA